MLRQFLLGAIDAATLEADLDGSLVTVGIETLHSIEDMKLPFKIEPAHLIRVCEAVIDDKLAPSRFQQIGFCVVASDTFFWDAAESQGALVAETVHEWAAPEINFALTQSNAAKWKLRLETGRDTLGHAS